MASSPRENLRELVRRSIETGRSLQQMSRSELEGALREFLSDPPGREQVEDVLEEVRARSRRGFDALTELVRAEVRREVGRELHRQREEAGERFGQGLEAVGAFLDRFLGSSARGEKHSAEAWDEVPNPTTPVSEPVEARKAAAKKVAARKAPAKKAAAKKAPAKKSAANPAGAKKAAAKKASPPPNTSTD